MENDERGYVQLLENVAAAAGRVDAAYEEIDPYASETDRTSTYEEFTPDLIDALLALRQALRALENRQVQRTRHGSRD